MPRLRSHGTALTPISLFRSVEEIAGVMSRRDRHMGVSPPDSLSWQNHRAVWAKDCKFLRQRARRDQPSTSAGPIIMREITDPFPHDSRQGTVQMTVGDL